MNESLDVHLPRHLEQNEGSCHVGLDDRGGLVNAPIHVGLSRKMDNHIAAPHRFFGRNRVADVSPHEGIIWVFRDRFQIGQVSRVCQLVEVDDLVLLMQEKDVADEV